MALALLGFHGSSANAYSISILGEPFAFSGGNLDFTITSNRISVSDFFDQYDETLWEIDSVTVDENGEVRVSYRFPTYGTWDSYGGWAGVQFQILSDSDSLTPEAVAVDLWGSSFYHWRIDHACCFSDAPEVEIFGSGMERRYTAPNDRYATYAETLTLMTNTPYYFDYYNNQYVEGSPQASFPRRNFASMTEYESYIAIHGTSGRIYAEASGFMNFNLLVSPDKGVPEPGTLALLGCGLAGIALARRRRASRLV